VKCLKVYDKIVEHNSNVGMEDRLKLGDSMNRKNSFFRGYAKKKHLLRHLS
jgi:hypothetical protein